MAEARLPTPRRHARTVAKQGGQTFSAIGQAVSAAGQVGTQYLDQRLKTEQQVEEIDHRIALAQRDEDDRVELIKQSANFVQVQHGIQEAINEQRENAEPFAEGHSTAIRQYLEAELTSFDEGIGNERVRQKFRDRLAQTASQFDLREQGWEREQKFKAQGEALDVTVTTYEQQLSRVVPAEIGAAYAMAITNTDELIEAGAFNADQEAAMKRDIRSKLAPAVVDSLFNAGEPQKVAELIKQGFFDGMEIDTDRLGKQVEGEQRALDIAAQQAQAEQQSQARALDDALRAKIAIGINPTQAEFKAAREAGIAAGLPAAELIEQGGLAMQMGLNRQFSEAKDPDGTKAARHVAQIAEKIANGTATEEEQVIYAHLAPVAEARAQAKGEALSEMADQGLQGQMAALAQVRNMPVEQRYAAAEAIQKGLGRISGLIPRTQKYALEGHAIRKQRGDDFGKQTEVKAAFNKIMGGSAQGLGQNHGPMMDLAWDLYAGAMAGRGRSGFDAKEFQTSVSIAFGARPRGNGQWQGGLGTIRGHKVILPHFQTANEFDRYIRSKPLTGAIYADGRKATKKEILDNYRPQYVRDNVAGDPMYHFIDESGLPLIAKGGQPYVVGVVS